LKQKILDRLKQLGGNIVDEQGKSLADNLLAIEFNTVLYENKIEMLGEEEPIYGISEFINENMPLFYSNKEMFYSKIVEPRIQFGCEVFREAMSFNFLDLFKTYLKRS